MNNNNWIYLFLIIIIYFVFVFFAENWIFTNEYLYRNLSEQIPVYSIDGILESRERYWWFSYLIQVVIVLCKVIFAAICIFIGVVFLDIKLSFQYLFKSVILGEFVFVFSQFLYLINLFTNKSNLTFETTANYFPLSILSFYGVENVVTWLHYPLQTLNVFLILYVILISWLLSKKWKPDFVESINIVLPSYGIGLLLWMVLVVFLTLQIS